jgi:2-oxoglutarate ferredoxin oxidoreductase subunit alpha
MSRELPKVGGSFCKRRVKLPRSTWCTARPGRSPSNDLFVQSRNRVQTRGDKLYCRCRTACVIVNMMRGGPGLGGIQPGQADYYQATRGGGNGDYRHIVYAPASVQETADIMMESFDVADQYRIPVMVLGDGMIGQMMEPVEFRDPPEERLSAEGLGDDGTDGRRKPNIINSLFLKPEELEEHNQRLAAKHRFIRGERDVRWETFSTDDAEIVFVSYGTRQRESFGTRWKCAPRRRESKPGSSVRSPCGRGPFAAFDAAGKFRAPRR